MSYILDALKKATSEREHQRGGVPDLYAQPVRTQGVNTAPHKASETPKLLLAAGLFAAIVTGLAWHHFGALSVSETQALSTLALASARANLPIAASITQPASPLAPTALVAPKVQTAQPEQVAPAAAENQAIQAVAASTTATFKPQPPAIPRIAVVSPVMPSPLPVPAVANDKSELNKPELKQRPFVKPPATRESTLPMVASPLVTPAQDTTVKLLPLPVTAPKLLVSGSTFSDNPAYRMLILNGQVYREGDSLGSDLRLDQIRLKAAVVSYQGQQYSLVY